MKLKVVVATIMTERMSCKPSLLVWSSVGSVDGPRMMAMRTHWPMKRIHTISAVAIEEWLTSHFAVASRQENSVTAPHISMTALSRSGRARRRCIDAGRVKRDGASHVAKHAEGRGRCDHASYISCRQMQPSAVTAGRSIGIPAAHDSAGPRAATAGNIRICVLFRT